MEPVPKRDGWVITRVGDNAWKAVRERELTAWQLVYGCQSVVVESSRAELELYLTAEQIKDSMIDMAARLVAGVREASEQRAQDGAGQ
jgi:hypothetical protein